MARNLGDARRLATSALHVSRRAIQAATGFDDGFAADALPLIPLPEPSPRHDGEKETRGTRPARGNLVYDWVCESSRGLVAPPPSASPLRAWRGEG